MLAFRTHSTLFTHVIAAASAVEAERVAISVTARPFAIVEQWHTPDIWTRRAVDMALAPGIIDTIPRFVVDRDDGPVYLDIDDVPAKLSNAEINKCMRDSPEHLAWLHMLRLDHSHNEELRAHVAALSKDRGDRRVEDLIVRALAGAWGLGPIPEWHAAILPALIALDIETTECTNAFCDNVFELDRAELIAELSRCASITHHIPGWCVASMRMLASKLSNNADAFDLRVRCNSVLALTGWLQ